MHDTDFEMAMASRQDFSAYDVPVEDLAAFKKVMSPFSKAAKESAKPERCLICGEGTHVLRFSHCAQIFSERDFR